MQKPDFRQILAAFVDYKVEFLIVGGIAAVLQGASFSTFDLDLIHARTPDNVKRLTACLKELRAHYRSRAEVAPTSEHLASPGHQLLSTVYGPLDLLGSIEGGRDYYALLPYSRSLDLGLNSTVQVLTLGMLLSLKEASSEPKDQNHALILRRVIEEEARLSKRHSKPE
jgi:hypothetical protein